MTVSHGSDPAALDERRPQPSAPVVVGVDGSDASWLALRWAAELASHRDRELHVVLGMNLDATRTVTAGCEVLLTKTIEELNHQATRVMVAARKAATEVDPGLRVWTEVSADNPARLLIGYAATAYVTVIGAPHNGYGLTRPGSTFNALIRHAPGCAVVVRDTGTERQIRERGPVVVGVDGSPAGDAAVGAAFEEAAERDTELVAVHVCSDVSFGEFLGRRSVTPAPADLQQPGLTVLAARLAGWQEKYPQVSVTRKVYVSAPFGHLLEWSHSAQLIVVGNRGRGGFPELSLGSTADSLIRYAYCPVMIARAEPSHALHGGSAR